MSIHSSLFLLYFVCIFKTRVCRCTSTFRITFSRWQSVYHISKQYDARVLTEASRRRLLLSKYLYIKREMRANPEISFALTEQTLNSRNMCRQNHRNTSFLSRCHIFICKGFFLQILAPILGDLSTKNTCPSLLGYLLPPSGREPTVCRAFEITLRKASVQF
jgi:hypothetical protein